MIDQVPRGSERGESMAARDTDTTTSVDTASAVRMESLAAGVRYLARMQHPAGSWSDFWLPVGASDAWVTAYVGIALDAASRCASLSPAARSLAGGSAERAVAWLVAAHRPLGGWGYNATVPVDADATAHAISLLARRGVAVPPAAVAVLRSHYVAGEGFRTYRRDAAHPWGQPHRDVTAAALRALHDCGAMEREELRVAWAALLHDHCDRRGWWHGYWWQTPNYPTGMVLEVWQAAGAPPLSRPVAAALPTATAFDLAWATMARARFTARAGESLAARFVALQASDGGWPSALILRVPPPLPATATAPVIAPTVAQDARRLFVTATAVRALALVGGDVARVPVPVSVPPVIVRPRRAATGRERGVFGRHADALVHRCARDLGFDISGADAAHGLFARLTRESVGRDCWPAPGLSSLSGGVPLEFSVQVGGRERPALRYAVEVGDPLAPLTARARAGVGAIARTAAALGYDAAWRRVRPAVMQLISPRIVPPTNERFWVWGGVDQAAPGEGDSPPPLVKVYLNLHAGATVTATGAAHETGARVRLEGGLAAAGIPRSPALHGILDLLDRDGFPHEIGFGIGPGGAIAAKVYYELAGWSRDRVRDILARAGLPDTAAHLLPEIPGVMRASLAAQGRTGIALRLDVADGSVREVTVATAFPLPFVPPAETVRRVRSWITVQGWDGAAYDALAATLGASDQHCHTLFTRTLTAHGHWATLYLRPR